LLQYQTGSKLVVMQKLGTNLYLLAAAMCLFARIFYE
jgi:hypothetical protein